MNIDFEPFKPINTSLYLCDNKFHTEALQELLESDDKFGFIVMDGNGSLYGTLAGNHREILHKFSVDLPKKHGRGGQSALRFARLRLEKRQNYVTKVAEIAKCSSPTTRSTSRGSSSPARPTSRTTSSRRTCFDQRLVAKIIKTVDVSYGGENGFNQAIELCAETLANVKFIQEKKLISKYFRGDLAGHRQVLLRHRRHPQGPRDGRRARTLIGVRPPAPLHTPHPRAARARWRR